MFIYADYQRKNIMVYIISPKLNVSSPDNVFEDEFEITIIDWEKVGWYPSYWEYCIAFCALRWDDDWGLWIGKVLNSYYPGATWLQMLRLELWS